MLRGLSGLSELRRLELRGCRLEEADLAAIKEIPKLRELSLIECTGLTDTAAPAFLLLEQLESIQTDFSGMSKERKKWLQREMKNFKPLDEVPWPPQNMF